MLHARIEYPKDRVEDPPSDLGKKKAEVVAEETKAEAETK